MFIAKQWLVRLIFQINGFSFCDASCLLSDQTDCFQGYELRRDNVGHNAAS